MKRTLLVLILSLLIAAPGFAQETATDDPMRGESVYKKCAGCHAVGEGAKNKIGPHLNGLIGRVAGSLPDYSYSEAMKEAGAKGLVWNIETLKPFLQKPKDAVPGTKMQFAGIPDEAELSNLLAYLASLNPASP